MLKNVLNLSYEYRNREEIILRDFLALERTRLANERTLLAYLRTSLYMVLGGIAFLQLKDFASIRWLGYVTIGLAGVFIVTGIVRFYHLRRSMREYYEENRLIGGSENSN